MSRPPRPWIALASLAFGLGGCGPSAPAERCGEGLVALGPRCCGEGQRLDAEQRCVGVASRCTTRMTLVEGRCVPVDGRVFLAGEHADGFAGFMEGAVRSGRRIAAAIVG